MEDLGIPSSPEVRSLPAVDAGYVNQAVNPLEQPGMDNEQLKYFEFSTARIHLKRIIDDWNTEVQDTEVRRKTRDVEVDVEGLRQKGDLDEDETLVPVRVIDTNISREKPAYINYLKNSRRICTFRSLDNPKQDPQNIEQEFTRGMTYCGWEADHYKVLDGAQTHGWAAVEVVFDESKPLNVGIEYVAHDELYWPRSVKKLQDSPIIIRPYDVTLLKLKEWVRKFGFDASQVDLIVNASKNTTKEPETKRIYKMMFKKEGIIFVGWFALTDGVVDWLKKPEQLFIGIYDKQMQMVPQQVQLGADPFTGLPLTGTQMVPQEVWSEAPVYQYPFFRLPYRETEKPKAVDNKGRVFLDESKQDAQTAILSGFVNGITRAANTFASPKQEDGTGSAIKELENIKLTGGRILSRPIEFWHQDYPDPMLINALQYFDISNSQEVGQVTFAAQNRQDSRKTATEVGASQQQQQLLNTVDLTLYSAFIREVYGFAWLIVRSQALINKIKFLLIEGPADPLTGQTSFTNDVATISQSWELRAAGDVDVIQRNEKITQMKQDWPVIANTPLALRFLCDLMKLTYPEVGDQYAEILMSGNPIAMIQALGTIISGIIKQHPEIMAEMAPNEQQQLGQLIDQAMKMTQTQGQQQQAPAK